MFKEEELIDVCVYPDGTQSYEPLDFMSDDYEWRRTIYCARCDSELQLHPNEPFATCGCGTQEWYK